VKNIPAFLFASTLCLITACSIAGSKAAPPAALSKEQKDLISDKDNGFCIMDNASLWEIGPGAPRLLATCGIGEKLTLLGKTSRAVVSGASRNLILVKQSNGPEAWARTELIVPDSILGVVVDNEAAMYARPNTRSSTGKNLPRMTIVAIQKNTAATAFLRVSCVGQESQEVHRGVYVANSGISSLVDDVRGAILYRIASRTENPRKKAAFLGSALNDYPRSKFTSDIKNALSAAQEPVPAEIPTEKLVAEFLTREEGVNVLTLPGEAGTVIATLPKGRTVASLERTLASYTIGSLIAPWYRIKDPEGWVFGVSLLRKQ
jgi:hypothetical protein